MPFLYLPDAISLILLLLALSLLRRSALVHFEQEMNRLQVDLFHCRIDAGFPAGVPSYTNLRHRIRSAIECAARVSPARLFCVARLLRKTPGFEWEHTLPEWCTGLEDRVGPVSDKRTQERLQRIQMECSMNLGVFYLVASISGWILTATVLFHLSWRLFSRRRANRVDWLFDMMERVFIQLGRRAHWLALLARED